MIARADVKVAIALLAAVPLPALAQDEGVGSAESPKIVSQMFDCRTIEEDDRRLDCYDREVERVYQAQLSRELIVADRSQLEEAKRGLFGLNLPKIRLFGNGDDDDEAQVDEIQATLAEATKLRNGRYIFTLEDGARWLETESASGSRRFKKGDEIVIERAALGSFKAKVNGKRAVRVRRLN